MKEERSEENMLKIKAGFERKPVNFYLWDCIVEKLIVLTDLEFEQYNMDLMEEQTFLQENRNLMFSSDDVYHCLLVLGENNTDGILIEAEGYNYARYAAFLPNARLLIEMEMQKVADYIIKEGTENTLQGCWNADFNELEERFGYKFTEGRGFEKMLLKILESSPEVSEVQMVDGRIELILEPDYCPNLDGKAESTPEISDYLIRFKDLIKDICLVHRHMDTKPVRIVSLGPSTLTDMGKKIWADVLNAPVVRIFHDSDGIQVECANVDPERLVQFSRSEHARGARLAERTIFSITEGGSTRNYSAPNKGSVLFGAKLLHALEDTRGSIDDESPVSVFGMLSKDYNFVDFKGRTVGLLHAMDDEAFSQAMERVECGEREDVYVQINFGTNRIRFMNLSQGDSFPALPLTSLADAYDQSLHNKTNKPYVNKEQFERLLEKICETQTEDSPLEACENEVVPEFKIGL